MSNVDDLFDELITEDDENKAVYEVSKMVSDIISDIVIKRNKLNLSQRKLAELCGMKQSSLARIECLQVMPRIDTLAKILNKLDMKLIAEDSGVCVKSNKTYCWSFISIADVFRNLINERDYKEVKEMSFDVGKQHSGF